MAWPERLRMWTAHHEAPVHRSLRRWWTYLNMSVVLVTREYAGDEHGVRFTRRIRCLRQTRPARDSRVPSRGSRVIAGTVSTAPATFDGRSLVTYTTRQIRTSCRDS